MAFNPIGITTDANGMFRRNNHIKDAKRMAFNPIGITTDANRMGRWPWSQKAEPAPTLANACCESQLMLINHNVRKFQKILDEHNPLTEDEMTEFLLSYDMFVAIRRGYFENPMEQSVSFDMVSSEINKTFENLSIRRKLHRRIVDATEMDIRIHYIDGPAETQKISIREQDSIFDEMTKFLEFNKWGTLMLRGQGIDECVYKGRECHGAEREKAFIDGSIRNTIRDYQLKGDLLHFEIRERVLDMEKMCINTPTAVEEQDKKIELRIYEAPIGGSDNRKNYQSRKLTIQKSANSNSMFEQIGEIVPYDNWGVVKLTDGVLGETLYEETSTAINLHHSPWARGRGVDFDEHFMTGMTGKIRGWRNFKSASSGMMIDQVYLEITKRYISDTRDEDVTQGEVKAEMLAARFQSITWV